MRFILQEIRYVLRLLRRSPGFAIGAVMMLGLGLALSTTMFGVLDSVLLKPLPYQRPGDLVQVWETDSSRGEIEGVISLPNFMDWEQQSHSFKEMATYEYGSAVLAQRKEPQRINVIFVSNGFFDVFERVAFKGRTFLHDDDPRKNQEVVLSFGAWHRYFGEDPDVVGRSITLDGEIFSVIGIMPPDFEFPSYAVDAWCLRAYDLSKLGRRKRFLFGISRLKPGVNLAAAQTEMSTIANRLAREYSSNRSSGVRLVRLRDEIVGNVKQKLLMLALAVFSVLLIACANIAGLLLARAISRKKEVAIRAALGCPRSRVALQFILESLVLVVAGSFVGLIFSMWVGPIVVASSHGTVPRLRGFRVDVWVVAFNIAAASLSGLLFGAAPALRLLRFDMVNGLKGDGLKPHAISGRLSSRTALVVGEIALAFTLSVVAILLTESLRSLERVDAGFQSESILAFRLSLPKNAYADGSERAALYQRLLDALITIPGVEAVGASDNLPFSGSRSSTSFEIQGHSISSTEALDADYQRLSPTFLQTIHAHLVQGRFFAGDDTNLSPRVVIVNEAFVARFLPRLKPLDQSLNVHNQTFRIVGVVSDIKHDNLAIASRPEMYLCYLQDYPSYWTFVTLRSHMSAASLTSEIRERINEVATGIPIYDAHSMDERIAATLGPQRFTSKLLMLFAISALLLAIIGIYAVITYTVAQRTHEIGIRLSLGAERCTIRNLILRSALKMASVGILCGSIVGFCAVRGIDSLLFGFRASSYVVFLAVAISLLIVVLLASYIPAHRASKVDPLEALHYE
jgi:putative ABC transport system permease protein